MVAGFPSDLFLTLVGVTLLFGSRANGHTLDRVSQLAVGYCRGNVGLMPVMFFLLAFGLSAVGCGGNIASAALIAPMAMAVAFRAGIPALLMAIMVAHGALAGALSPFAPTGVIANNLLRGQDAASGSRKTWLTFVLQFSSGQHNRGICWVPDTWRLAAFLPVAAELVRDQRLKEVIEGYADLDDDIDRLGADTG